MLVQYTTVVPLKYEKVKMNLVKEIKDEDWATLMENVENALGVDARRLIEHKVAVLQAIALRYELEADEDNGADIWGG